MKITLKQIVISEEIFTIKPMKIIIKIKITRRNIWKRWSVNLTLPIP